MSPISPFCPLILLVATKGASTDVSVFPKNSSGILSLSLSLVEGVSAVSLSESSFESLLRVVRKWIEG